MQRPLYYTRLACGSRRRRRDALHVDAAPPQLDGGVTWTSGNAGGDNHDIWIDPLLPDRMIVGHDGGMSISTNRGRVWLRPRCRSRRCTTSSSTTRFPTTSWATARTALAPRSQQQPDRRQHPHRRVALGGRLRVGFAVPPADNDIVWSGCYDGILDVYDLRTGQAAQRQRLARQPRGLGGRRAALPLPVDLPDPRLAARSEQGVTSAASSSTGPPTRA